MTRYLETNNDLWNRWTKLHPESNFYDLDGFKAGGESLNPLEIGELGDVSGKTHSERGQLAAQVYPSFAPSRSQVWYNIL